jgi:hypothetical protein
MKVLNWIFAGYWAILAVLVFCGVEFSSWLIGCGFGIASLSFVNFALWD